VFDHILLALDDPRETTTLMPHFLRIARSKASRVTVMKLVSFLETVVEMPGELSPNLHGDDETAESLVAALVEHLRSEGIRAEGFTEIGRSALTVAAAAESIGSSLVVIALRRRSLAQELFRICRVPVLAVPDGRRRRAPQVLVPIEDSGSLDVIPHAAIMARTFRAGILFVAEEKQELLPQARELAQRELVSTEVTLLAEDLATTLLELPGALIVLRHLSGGTAARLIRESKVPLLVVRHPPPLPEPRAETPMEFPATLRARRVPFNPLEGIGEP